MRNQCCVVTGESGAGKTESGKFIVKHLLDVAESGEKGLSVRIQQVCAPTFTFASISICLLGMFEGRIREFQHLYRYAFAHTPMCWPLGREAGRSEGEVGEMREREKQREREIEIERERGEERKKS